MTTALPGLPDGVSVQIAPTVGCVHPSAISSGAWVTVNALKAEWQRGTANETSQPTAGKASFTLYNMVGELSTWNPSAIVNKVMGMPIRVLMTVGATTIVRFFGYVNVWVPEFGAGWNQISVEAGDELALLAKVFEPTSWFGYTYLSQSSLQAWYRFKEKTSSQTTNAGVSYIAKDSSGNGNDAFYNIMTGVVVSASHGPNPSPVYAMAGGNVTLPPSTGGITGASNFTVAAVISVDDTVEEQSNARPQPIMNVNGGNGGGGWTLNLTVGGFQEYELSLIWYDTSNNAYVVTSTYPSSNGLVAGDEYLVHIVRNGTSLSLYQNGGLIGTVTIPAMTLTAPLQIIPSGGPGGTSYPGQFYGGVGDVGVFNTNLSSGVIANQVSYFQDTARTTDAWIQLMLTSLGWTSSDWSMEAGLTTLVQPDSGGSDVNVKTGGQDGRSAIQTAATDEQGLFFVNGAGKFIFYNRQHTLPYFLSPSATLGNAPGAFPLLTGAKVRNDDMLLFTEATVTRSGGVDQLAEGPTAAQTLYRKRTDRLGSSLNLLSDAEAGYLAQSRARRGSTEYYRYPTVAFKPWTAGSPSAAWALALNLELWQAVTISNGAPDGTGSRLTGVHIIQGIKETITPNEWTVTLQLVPQDTTNYLVPGDATFGDPTANYLPY